MILYNISKVDDGSANISAAPVMSRTRCGSCSSGCMRSLRRRAVHDDAFTQGLKKPMG